MPEQNNAPKDIYAGIATTQLSRRSTSLVEPQPLAIPDHALPLNNDAAVGFEPGAKLDSEAKIQR